MSTISEQLERRVRQIGTEDGNEFTNMLKTLESVFQSPKHWVLEFLQNAEDAGAKSVLIQLDPDSLWVMNDGRPFNDEDVASVCSVNSRKLPALGFKGYIGIGFKSIFRVTDEVEIHSGEFNFKFSKLDWRGLSEKRGVSMSKVPWEVLPVEITPHRLPDDYVTGFYVPLAEAKARGVHQEIEDFLSSPDFPKEAILLLDNVETIRLQTAGTLATITKSLVECEPLTVGKRNLVRVTKEILSTGMIEEASYQVFRKVVSVPGPVKDDPETDRVRRSDVDDREIGLIFGVGPDNRLETLQGKLTGVYSFLPIEGEQTGLPFGIFGDFIPQPGRDLINYGAAWNQWMCGEVQTYLEEVVRGVFLKEAAWAPFPLQLLRGIPYAPITGPGQQYWDTQLRSKVQAFLETEALHPDAQGSPTRVQDLMAVDADVLGLVGQEALEDLLGKKLAHPSIQQLVGESVGVYESLHNTKVIEFCSRQPATLIGLYHMIEGLRDYYIEGRPYRDGRRGRRDTPLPQVPFVLAADGKVYPPNQVFVPQTDLDTVPAFLRVVVSGDKQLLHPSVATDLDAVKQLGRCGVEIIDNSRVVSTLVGIVDRVTERAGCPDEWNYPEDLIKATMFVAAQNGPPVNRLVADDNTVRDSHLCFVAGADLDWQPLWQANLLPGFSPVHPSYTNASIARESGLEIQQVRDYLLACRAHGFDHDRDGGLTEAAAYAVATQRLVARGHILAPVTQRHNLGYDFECSGHCSRVFEVKGQSEPRDEILPESETNAATQKKEDYVLVFVYNLPCRPDNIGYTEIPNPKTIFVPIDRARVPRERWLAHK